MKIEAKAFEAGDFLTFSYVFGVFEAHFLIKIFLMKKTCNGKDWRAWRKKYLVVDGFVMDKVLDQTKEIIGIKKFDGTKILINQDDKLSDDIIVKSCDINDMCY